MEKKPYLVSQNTMALEPIYHEVFRTKIYDVQGIYYSTLTSMELLEAACLERGSDYSGRIKAVRRKLGYLKKTPLMISRHEMIYAFPTKSPEDYDNVWIFHRHIQSFQALRRKVVAVVFANEMTIEVNCSSYTFQTQREKTAQCLCHFSSPPFTKLHSSQKSNPVNT
ncbi:competence protein ComK [Falsibacillus albus]|nr:competence protein ComK [Falsibacillus albus]